MPSALEMLSHLILNNSIKWVTEVQVKNIAQGNTVKKSYTQSLSPGQSDFKSCLATVHANLLMK